MRRKLLLSSVFLVGMIASGCAAYAVELRPVPPPPRHAIIGRAPGPGFVWMDGFWDWRGHHWVWVEGRWMRPPRGRSAWVAGRWEERGRGHWVFVRGYWRR